MFPSRVATGTDETSVGECLAAGVGEGDIGVAAEAEVHGAAVDVEVLVTVVDAAGPDGESEAVVATRHRMS